jgi:hypothetical protein
MILQIPDSLFVSNADRIFTGTHKGIIMKNKDAEKEGKGNLVEIPKEYGLDVDIQILSEEKNIVLTTMSGLLEQSKSYVGVFSALYGSLIDSAEVGITSDGSAFSNFLNALISALYVAALLIPLLTLVVILY